MFTLEQLKILNGNTITERDRVLYRLTIDELKSKGFNYVIIGILSDETNLKNRIVILEYVKDIWSSRWCVIRFRIILSRKFKDFIVNVL